MFHFRFSEKMGKKCFYQQSWEQEFPFLKPSSKGNTYAYCSLCDKDILLSNMGRCAVQSHIKGSKHLKIKSDKGKIYGIRIFNVSNEVNLIL